MSDTPKTDANCGWPWGHHGRIETGDLRWSPDGPFVHSSVARELERENAALRVALNEFSNLSYVALLAPVPNARPHYALVKKHEALLNNGLKKEAQP